MQFVKMRHPDIIAFAHKDTEQNPMQKLHANKQMSTFCAIVTLIVPTMPNASKDNASVRMVSKHPVQFVLILMNAVAIQMHADLVQHASTFKDHINVNAMQD